MKNLSDRAANLERFAWLSISLFLILMAPSVLWMKEPIWRLSADHSLAPLAMSLAFVVIYGLDLRISQRLVIGVAVIVTLFVVIIYLPGRHYSRVSVAIAASMATALALAPAMLPRRLLLSAMVPLGAAAVILVYASVTLDMDNPADANAAKPTALYALTITPHAGPSSRMDGGAMDRYRDGVLLVTGDGDFFLLDDAMHAEKLPIPSPLVNRDALLADEAHKKFRLRVTDLLVDGRAIYVAHQVWHPDRKCFAMRLSRWFAKEWEQLHETQPCLSPQSPFDDSETGGRLARAEGGILMSVGDHGLDGRTGDAFAQSGNDYGKVLLVTNAGTSIFTNGHRNPQGLHVTSDGLIWETEHGPQGGDELNLLRFGHNYGWPHATYGTQYGMRTWPLTSTTDHGEYNEPVIAFVPSIAISNLIRYDGDLFSSWRGDLLVGSLRTKTLYRVRVRNNVVRYVEPIYIGHEIRDLVELDDGRVLLWDDAGTLIQVARSSTTSPLERCMTCHGGPYPVAPTLAGVVGRKIAAVPAYPYSDELQSLGGVWDKKALDKFLSAPTAPMRAGAVMDAKERQMIIESLAGVD